MIDFDRISALAMLSVSENDRESYKRDIENIISFADKIADFGESAQNERISAEKGTDELREDAPEPSFCRDEMLMNVPKASEGFISVPKSF